MSLPNIELSGEFWPPPPCHHPPAARPGMAPTRGASFGNCRRVWSRTPRLSSAQQCELKNKVIQAHTTRTPVPWGSSCRNFNRMR